MIPLKPATELLAAAHGIQLIWSLPGHSSPLTPGGSSIVLTPVSKRDVLAGKDRISSVNVQVVKNGEFLYRKKVTHGRIFADVSPRTLDREIKRAIKAITA